ncbi:MAG: aldehyde dehydrogenase family protein [Spirochaetia bacterium]|nr:aldehyde dehydrogenase family protein [Spirochaetia bacterium]
MNASTKKRKKTQKNIIQINPANYKKIGEFPITLASDVTEAVQNARRAQQGWAELPLKKRAALLKVFRKKIAANRNEIIRIITEETGKAKIDALIEVLDLVGHLSYLSRKGPKILSPQKRSSGLFFWKKASVMYSPYGVVGAITAWNYPLILSMEPVIQALMAGNAAVLKPSDFTNRTALYLKELATHAGIPEYVFSVITGDGSTGKALIESETDLISFIGSTENGMKIAKRCAELFKPCILELGGNDPMIVFQDADLSRALNASTMAFHNSGHSCVSIERILIENSIYESFSAAIKERAKNIRVGNPDEDIDMGCIANKMQYNKFFQHLNDARKKGAFITGGEKIKNKSGLHVSPAVIENANHRMLVLREETFGPSVVLQRFSGEEEALRLANQSDHGLGASVWTKSRKKASRICEKLEAGNIAVNEALLFYLVPDLPLGGLKKSGSGKSHAREGLLHYTRQKSILKDRLGLPSEIWWYPYSRLKYRLLDLAIKIFYS